MNTNNEKHIDSVNRKIGELKLKYLNFSNLDEEKKAKKKVRRRFKKKKSSPISLQMNLCKIVFLFPKSTIVRFFSKIFSAPVTNPAHPTEGRYGWVLRFGMRKCLVISKDWI